MSIISVVFVRNGIIMSSDSRGTHTRVINGQEVTKTQDRASKTFLIKTINTGISYCGNMRVEGKLFHEFIEEFAEKDLTIADNVHTIAEKLLKKINGSGIFVCGYEKEEPYVYYVTDHIERINIKNGKLAYGIDLKGKPDSSWELYNQKYRGKIEYNNVSLVDAVNLSEEMIECAMKNEESCGGVISTLAIFKNDYKWVRKPFLKQEYDVKQASV